ncbi:MAG TPA: hypothetical protein VLB02_01605 [Candidatus Paceibacterota bacterium]|nr:hypothetical protein [Candidatus Paceibacterota bacterium]
MKKFIRVLARITALFVVLPLLFPLTVQAAGVTSFSVTLSRLKASTAANQEIKFVTPTGLTAGQTITLTWSADFTMNTFDFADVDFATGDSSNCATASFSEQTLAGTPSGATWGAALSSSTLTLTSGTGTVTASRCVRFRIGTNAVTGTTGDTQITNGAADDDDTVVVGGTFGDSGTAAVDIITDDQVSVTATVDPTITFTISDTTIGFGTLSSSAARWATGDTSGSGTDTSAHNLTVATNAASGYAVTYNGATLTKGSDTIDVASVNNDANGTPGTEEFGLSVSTSGNATIATGYNHGDPDWTFVAGTTTTILSETVPTATETVSTYYLGNIAGDTPAGAYSTTLTYIASANF